MSNRSRTAVVYFITAVVALAAREVWERFVPNNHWWDRLFAFSVAWVLVSLVCRRLFGVVPRETPYSDSPSMHL